MQVKLGALDFEAETYIPEEPHFAGMNGWVRSGPLGPLDWSLEEKSSRKVYIYACDTQAETRIKLGPQDEYVVDTSLEFWVPDKRFKLPATDRDKSRDFGKAVIKASGLGSLAAFDAALQARFQSYTVKAPIADFKKSHGPNLSFNVYADIRYEHFRLRLPGKRLKGVIIASFPMQVSFWSMVTGKCAGAPKGVKDYEYRYGDSFPLLPTSLDLLGVVAKAHARQKPAIEKRIADDKSTAEYGKKTIEEDLKTPLGKKMGHWYRDYEEMAKNREDRLRKFEEALEKRRREAEGK